MVEHHLSLGAHLLLWAFPLVLATATVALSFARRPRRGPEP
jgi:hypothetical protein